MPLKLRPSPRLSLRGTVASAVHRGAQQVVCFGQAALLLELSSCLFRVESQSGSQNARIVFNTDPGGVVESSLTFEYAAGKTDTSTTVDLPTASYLRATRPTST